MTDAPTLDAAGKERVFAALLEHALASLDALATQAGVEADAARPGLDIATDEAERALPDETSELVDATQRVQRSQQDTVDRIRGLDTSATDVVRDGAVVGFGGDRYVVGVVSDAFECDGVTYEGISADAPVHAAVSGLRVGDTATVGGREVRIDLVA